MSLQHDSRGPGPASQDSGAPDALGRKPAEPATRTANAAFKEKLPFHDRADYEEAWRGFVAALPEGIVKSAGGAALWNLNEYAFLSADEAPATVNPSLWRMAQLNLAAGLFKVADRIYQIRGLDIANMTLIEGDTGLIIIDPLTTCEVSRAGLELYFAHRPKRPVVSVIYTHSHMDHFGGVKGVISDDDVKAGRVSVIAPDGFMEAVGGENVLAGLPMARRAQFQFGPLLAKGERGQVDAGLGKGVARGTLSLIAPTDIIEQPTERRTIDGIAFVFQLAPETEAPAEMHIFMPEHRVLNMAENATRHLHNFIPLRGAVVRDPRIWSKYMAEAMELFGPNTDILIGQHHWPTWGRDNILAFLAKQRDLYKHIHDQALRLMNKGYRPAEIAEVLDLPPGLAQVWPMRGYYGSVSHNAKAVYQRYLSWYDGNPANLNPLPPRETARKAVEYMGGAGAVLSRAREDFRRGEFRWVAQVASQLVFAEPENADARALCADAFEQLGYQAESATWRNAYLYAVQELRQGRMKLPPRPLLSPDLISGLSTDIFFDFIAIRLDPMKAAGKTWRFNWTFTDTGESLALNLENSTLTHMLGKRHAKPDASVTTTRAIFDAVALKKATMAESVAAGQTRIEGDVAKLAQLFGMLDEFEMMFPVVTPT
ncbi:MAG TPA: alkyl sulfatase dimerization domain-containing protein [Candidatus Cybelea sp.]|nr:alkyl sulfatase dimerization domain-containing protein [Candidatus Cybelea sp.]